jgi:hypothetical protein
LIINYLHSDSFVPQNDKKLHPAKIVKESN